MLVTKESREWKIEKCHESPKHGSTCMSPEIAWRALLAPYML